MLLTAIELQGGQANIEGKSVTSHLTKNADCSSINSLLILYRNNFQLFYSDLVTAMTTKKG